MMRNAFTMIELIFVIVILGILSMVALPKLASARDDAKIVSKSQEVQASITEITAGVAAIGRVFTPQEMSQVLNQLVLQGKANITLNNPIPSSVGQLTLYTQDGASHDSAFIIDVNNTLLVLKHAIPCNGVICKKLQIRVSEGNFSLGGSSIVF